MCQVCQCVTYRVSASSSKAKRLFISASWWLFNVKHQPRDRERVFSGIRAPHHDLQYYRGAAQSLPFIGVSRCVSPAKIDTPDTARGINSEWGLARRATPPLEIISRKGKCRVVREAGGAVRCGARGAGCILGRSRGLGRGLGRFVEEGSLLRVDGDAPIARTIAAGVRL